MLWGQARPITEKDLVAAEAAWARRKHTQSRSHKENEEVGPQENRKSTLDLKTVHFLGRIKPNQRNIRSAAALLSLDGHQGRTMPLTAFSFLFSGGRTPRAFKQHENKFNVDHLQVSLKPEYVGYFVGEDGTLESCTDHTRRKSAGAQLLADTAAWMRGQGLRPVTLEGTEESASFDVRSDGSNAGATQSAGTQKPLSRA